MRNESNKLINDVRNDIKHPEHQDLRCVSLWKEARTSVNLSG